MLAACGGGDDDATTAPTATTADSGDDGGDDDTATPGDGGDDDGDDAGVDSIQVNETFWHAGYEVSLGAASVVDNVVELNAVFKNLGAADNATFDSRVALRSGGNDYLDTATFDEDLPAIPARGQKTGNFAIRVDEDFTFDDATMFIGHPDNNQAIIPLGPDSPDELLTLEPQELTINGQGIAGAVTVDLEGGEIRADLPNQYSIEDKDHLALTLRFSVTPAVGISTGQGVFQSANVKLRQPDGSTVNVRSDGESGVNELLQGEEGNKIDDLSIRFDVEKPAPGEYGLIIIGNYGPAGAEVSDEITFTVPALPTLGE